MSKEDRVKAQSKPSDKTEAKAAEAKAVEAKAAEAKAARAERNDAARLSDKIAPKTRLRLFLESSLFDFIMVLMVSVSLTFTVSYAFYSAGDYRGNVALLIAITAPLLIALFLGGWSKKALIPSAIITALIAAVIIGVAAAFTPSDIPMFTQSQKVLGVLLVAPTRVVNDVDENYVIFAMIAVVIPVLVFLLSRRTAGLVILMAGCVIATGTVQFLYRDWMESEPWLPAFVCMLLGVGMLFVYQCYRQSVYSAKRLKRTTFLGAFVFSTLVGAVCVLFGLGVFYGVLDSMGIETPELKFFQNYVSAPISEHEGVYTDFAVIGDDTTSETNDNDPEETNDDAEGEGQASEGLLAQISGLLSQISKAFDFDASEAESNQINYLIIRLATIIITILLILLIVGIILGRRAMRERRLKKIENASSAYRMWYLYTFFLERLRRMKIRKPAYLTPLEFALGFRKTMQPFTRNTGGVDFVEVTILYMDVCYGDKPLDSKDYERVKSYYRAFFKNAREYVGWPKWVLWKFWRI